MVVSCRCSGMSTTAVKTEAERADEMIAWHRVQSERLVREHIESVLSTMDPERAELLRKINGLVAA